ncbi:gliding motility-associated peptidyl-prolyl isomerase GldI [Flavobacterium salilacus subsp. salilacus]|uniref:gliding motility-associated peptidyl-prolyl isomerase GldI n=1 Tax=Flavobacterium TaxID=237 RepID=UPI001075170C|nr:MULTISPECIES: gliding motility-associated peptidyl-prolyl isomerase GldI [Flavobacterium]KAF2518438.1 gliding motility-associated peptidyl-prolyl isomerase GldI [Flavobacterium salilacus subsp. salilacus]MBE1615076.1 gliding motility-associated peptidyl-prolyl isomerase GldI [Flavobacterium sp. SaA2.13]NDI98066.1 gliding motility-associated peptidyl-prolyl isomerase GldI [Flavobacterium salilacus subsp. altitudinum]
MKKIFFTMLFLIGIILTGCSQQQQARRPVSQSSGSAFINESVERNRKLIAEEEALIDSIIKSNPHIDYIASDKGYWYHYEIENTTDTLKPKRGDVAYFDYDVKDLNGNIIYSEAELKPQVYYVDKENIMMGLRSGIKLMREGEKVTFLFPSNMGYGYHGDNNKIGINQPLVCTVTLHDIQPENEVKKQ